MRRMPSERGKGRWVPNGSEIWLIQVENMYKCPTIRVAYRSVQKRDWQSLKEMLDSNSDVARSLVAFPQRRSIISHF